MGDMPRNDAASLSLEAALYDSKSGRFSPQPQQPQQGAIAKPGASSSHPVQDHRAK